MAYSLLDTQNMLGYQQVLKNRDKNLSRGLDRARGRGAYGDPAAPGKPMGAGYRYSDEGKAQRAKFGMTVSPTGGPFGTGNPYNRGAGPTQAMVAGGGGGGLTGGYGAGGAGGLGGGVGGYAGGGYGLGGAGTTLDSLIKSYKEEHDAAFKANEQRYNQIDQAYTDRYGRAMDYLTGAGQQEEADIREARQAELGYAEQDLIDRGLTGTTILGNTRSLNTRETAKDVGRLKERVRQQLLDTDARLSGDQLLFEERRDDNYPDPALLASLAQTIGQGGNYSGGYAPGYDPYGGLGGYASPQGNPQGNFQNFVGAAGNYFRSGSNRAAGSYGMTAADDPFGVNGPPGQGRAQQQQQQALPGGRTLNRQAAMAVLRQKDLLTAIQMYPNDEALLRSLASQYGLGRM